MIYHTDCVPFLEKLCKTKESFDLVLSDPPYNIGKSFGSNSDNIPIDDYFNHTRLVLEICAKLLKPTGSIVWFCSHRYVGYIQTILYDLGLHYKRMLIWHYMNGMSRQKKTPVTEYEPILWFSKSEEDFIYNVDDMRVPYRSERVKNPVYKTDSKGIKRVWKPNEKGALRGDVWKYPVLAGKLYENERTEHPTQKPEKLITDLIRAFCPKGGKVLDPFMGSGTTAVCCEKLKVDWIGSELEEKWVNVANNRLKNLSQSTENIIAS